MSNKHRRVQRRLQERRRSSVDRELLAKLHRPDAIQAMLDSRPTEETTDDDE